MTGRCELHITATTNPIPGCIINLTNTSPDAWLFFPNIRPSVFSAYYLSQVKVNGAAAVEGSNCRVDQFVMGTVVIPQPPSYTPLQVFSAQNFLGAAAQFGIYTYYTNNIGGMNRNISSFRLKHGYAATFAQNADGTGASQVFIAQDSDLEVGVMPTNLDHCCSFVRVYPWRWTGKKGWVGGISSSTALIDPLWNYDYDNVATSTIDTEYVPMRDTAYWDDYANINGKQQSTHVLAFNEPDQANQANMTVAAAIAQWPSLMQSGLRVGAPAVSSSGVSGQGPDWLYSFMSSATNLGYRVDFIPVHFYKCSWTSTQLSNYLAGIYQVTGRPIWVTEFNNGESSCGNVTLAANATAISSYISMMESCPFVERYAVYEYFDPSTGLNLITTNSPAALTPAGVVYANQQSGMAYTQTLPPGGSRSIAQFEFETNTLDSSGFGNNGFAVGDPVYTAGHTGQAVALDGANSFIRLPPNVANSTNFSIAAWVYWNGGVQWQRIFDFGDDTSHYLFLTPYSGGSTLRFAINNGGGEQQLNAPQLAANTWIHVAVTLSGGNAALYTNGVLAASSSSFTISPASFNPNLNYLGKSQFSADPLFSGDLDEVQVADYAFTPTQVAALMTDIPPHFSTNLIAAGSATQGQAYIGSIAGTATGTGALTYSKASGPAWLIIAASGALSGTPGFNDVGTNMFTARVTDAAGASAFTVVSLILPNIFNAGTWNADSSGNWSDTTKWSGGIPADGAGYTADFSTVNISANRTVTLDGSRSIGNLLFGDTSGSQTWTAIPTNGSVLTLDTGSQSSPSIVVNQNTATLATPLAGINGFAKSGAGILILATNNPLAGNLYIDSGITSATSEGAVRIANPSAIANILSPISIRDDNSASSTLQLDGTAGSITVSQGIALNGRNVNVVSIENVAGTNTLAGNLTINVGGGYYPIQSDAGLLTLSGTVSSVATGSRTFTFQGNGNTTISGALADGSASISAVKSGTGTLTLLGANAYSGTTTISGGTLQVGNGGTAGTLGTNNVTDNSALTFNLSGAVTAPNTIAGSGSVSNLGSGTLTFNTANSYTGGTKLSQGIIQANNNASFGTGTITSDTGNNTGRIILGSGVTITNPFVANSANSGAGGIGLIMVNDNTSATYSGSITFNANATAGGHFAGPPTTGLLTISGPVYSGATNFLVIRAGNLRFSGGGSYGEIQVRANTTSLGANNGLATIAAVDLGGNGSTTTPTSLDLNGFNQTLGGLKDTVTPANAAWVTNSGAATNTLTLNLGNTNYSFGGSLVGRVAVTLNSGAQTFAKSGTAALNGLYTYAGNTAVTGGTLALASGITLPNTPQISLGAAGTLDVSAGGLTVGAAQTLTGGGTVLGNLTVNGTLAPGGGIGVLTCSNNVTLQAGSTDYIELNKTLGTNDQLRVGGTLAYAGTLFVTNLSGTLASGDSFKIFYATNYNGSFAAFKLPALGTGLAWNTTNLVINGTLSIVTTNGPQFRSITQSGDGNYLFNGTGSAGVSYELDGTTNLAPPVFWLFVTNSVADQAGLLQMSDTSATNFPQRFYRITSGQ
jgi:autotransporter-associated beta strand protein